MKSIIYGAALGVTAILIAGCADDGYRGGGGISYYDGYYDGSYGPFYDGYWANDGYFYYSSAEGRPYVRDESHHFRHDRAKGYARVHGHGWSHGDGDHMRPGNAVTHEHGFDHDHDHDHDH
jgi:hypothetical protein